MAEPITDEPLPPFGMRQRLILVVCKLGAVLSALNTAFVSTALPAIMA